MEAKSKPKAVDIDPRGSFKYILVKAVSDQNQQDQQEKQEYLLVRGYADCVWHADIFDRVATELKSFRCTCLGGGKIDHDPVKQTIEIYGISQGFGKADHETTAEIIKKRYSHYTIYVNNDD